MMPNFDSIPEKLKAFPNWVLFKIKLRYDKAGKPTIDPETGKQRKEKKPFQVNGREAKPNDPRTWADFETVKKAFLDSKGKYQGIGFVFSENTGFIGMDFDKIRDPLTGEWNKDALKEIKSLNSYTELSPSETGAHVIGKGKMPAAGRNRNHREMYSNLHYFAVTGNVINGLKITINEIPQDIINFYYSKWFEDVQEKPTTQTNKTIYTGLLCCATLSPELSDIQVLEKCRNAGNSQKFIKLFEKGDISGYKSASEADYALCTILAFYTQKLEQLDRLFKGSRLYREEWNRKGYRTIQNAVKNLKGSYQPKKVQV